MRVELNITYKDMSMEDFYGLLKLIEKYDPNYTKRTGFRIVNGEVDVSYTKFIFTGIVPPFIQSKFENELKELNIYIDDDFVRYSDSFNREWVIEASYIPKKKELVTIKIIDRDNGVIFSTAIEKANQEDLAYDIDRFLIKKSMELLDYEVFDNLILVHAKYIEPAIKTRMPKSSGRYPWQPSTWVNGPFNIYYGEEHATGRHKTIVKWCDNTTTTVYKIDNKPAPVIYPFSYAFVKKLFGSNSQFKKWVDKNTFKFTPTQYVVEGTKTSPNTSYKNELSVRFTFPAKSKGSIDIYDQAAMMLAADYYGGIKSLNEMIKEAICENGK